jgi:hypothetical protein
MADQTTPDHKTITDGLRYAETIQKLDDRSAKKIALALAGINPALFMELREATRDQVTDNTTLYRTVKTGPVEIGIPSTPASVSGTGGK